MTKTNETTGRIGGKSRSAAKRAASRINGCKGGRPVDKNSLASRAEKLGISRQALWERERKMQKITP